MVTIVGIYKNSIAKSGINTTADRKNDITKSVKITKTDISYQSSLLNAVLTSWLLYKRSQERSASLISNSL